MSGRRKLAIFAGKVFILIIILASLWTMAADTYAQTLAIVTDQVAPSGVTYRAEDSSIVINYQDGQKKATLTVNGLSMQYGLVILLALIIATPGLKVRNLLKLILAAVVVMFIIHVIGMAAMGKLAQSISPEHPSVAGNPLHILFVSLGFDLFPILVWVGLSSKYWLPLLSREGVKSVSLGEMSRRNSVSYSKRQYEG